MPLTTKNLDYNIKLIDVSCGSGIFLVTAFKRLVQRWRIANKVNRELANPTPEILKSILKKNIFGVDINNIASDLTIFSLNLSLCSMLTPRQIWTELRFDNLKKDGNIICEDFFEYLVHDKPNDFDLVLGNPPFKGLKKESYAQYEKLLQATNRLLCKIPDNQLALMFLDKAMDVLKSNGLLCLIMPSGPLLYNNTLSFRKLFFEKFNIPQIVDFTLSRNSLFYEAHVAVAAIFVQKQSPNGKNILHLTVNRTKASKEKSYFEIDHYDFHDVPKSIATKSEFIWKANLLGGTRVYHLIERFRDPSFQTFKQFLQSNKDNRQWDFGQGYIVGEANSKFKAAYISGKPSVIDKGFNDEGITATEIQNAIYFKDIRVCLKIFDLKY